MSVPSNVYLAFSQMILPLVLQPLGLEDYYMDLSLTRKKNESFQTSILALSLKILYAAGLAVYSEDAQNRCDIPVIEFSNNLISLYHILPETMI